MKSLAAVNIRQFERAVESLEQYRAVIDLGWQVLLRYGAPLPRKRRPNRAICVIIGSDQGMCGQFNEILIGYALEEIKNLEKNIMKVTCWSVGEKIFHALKDMGFKEGEHVSTPDSLSAVHSRVQIMLQKIQSWRSSQEIEQIHVCHNVVSESGGYTQSFYRLLPLDKAWAETYTEKKWPGRCLPMLGLSQESMFHYLFQHYLFVSFFRALTQSLAAENAARLMAMQSAEKNILETQENLLARFREQRQADITNELLDIVSGFEALSEEKIAI